MARCLNCGIHENPLTMRLYSGYCGLKCATDHLTARAEKALAEVAALKERLDNALHVQEMALAGQEKAEAALAEANEKVLDLESHERYAAERLNVILGNKRNALDIGVAVEHVKDFLVPRVRRKALEEAAEICRKHAMGESSNLRHDGALACEQKILAAREVERG